MIYTKGEKWKHGLKTITGYIYSLWSNILILNSNILNIIFNLVFIYQTGRSFYILQVYTYPHSESTFYMFFLACHPKPVPNSSLVYFLLKSPLTENVCQIMIRHNGNYIANFYQEMYVITNYQSDSVWSGWRKFVTFRCASR